MRRKSDLYTRVAARVIRRGDLRDLLTDAVLRQDLRWVEDQIAGRRSVI